MRIRIAAALILLLFFVLYAPAFAGNRTLLNYPYLYRGARSLGMGGAYTAVGRDAEALFYNPATLYDMDLKLNIINPIAEADKTAINIYSDVMDAMELDDETERLNRLTEIINANMGKNLHVRAGFFPGGGYKNFAVGFLGQAEIDGRLHNPLGSAGAVEVNGGYSYGPVAGFSFPTGIEGLRAGVGAKWVERSWISENFTARQLASDTFDINDYRHDTSDWSLDAGILYDIPLWKSLKPAAGLSVLDITDLDFEGGGKLPTRANVGLSVNPVVPYLGDFIVALDYEDITHAREQDGSVWKRVHTGMEWGLLKRHLLLRAGLNQGYGTFGAEVDLWALKLAYTYYSEEMGAYAGQDRDERQLVYLNIGW